MKQGNVKENRQINTCRVICSKIFENKNDIRTEYRHDNSICFTRRRNII